MSKSDIIHTPKKRTIEQLNRLRNLPLEQKVNLSLRRIEQFYTAMDGKVYIAFSGGKDSTVLKHLVQSIHPEVPSVFSDTGLEYPEIRDFVKTTDSIWVKPKKTFKQVIDEYGYPVVSKSVAYKVSMIRRSGENSKSSKLYLTGVTSDGRSATSWKLPQKWRFLIDAPFNVSPKCCDFLKKEPLDIYSKETGRKPIIGIMTEESNTRKKDWFLYGCNSFNGKISSKPMAFWREQDVWEYIKSRELKYASVYDNGISRTGCIFCLFGYWQEAHNRFDILQKNHPNLYKYCMENLGMKSVIEYIDSNLNGNQKELEGFDA